MDVSVLRRTALLAWVLLALAALAAFSAIRQDRRWRTRIVGTAALALALLFSAGIVFGTRVPEPQASAAADFATDFTLPDAEGRPVALRAAYSGGPVLLVFYRGFW